MTLMQKNKLHYLQFPCSVLLLFVFFNSSRAQQQPAGKNNLQYNPAFTAKPLLHALAGNNGDLFGTRTGYVENIGQFDPPAAYAYMGKVLYGYEGLNMPVLFTARGVISLHRKIKKPSKDEIERMERKGMSEREIEEKIIPVDRTITMEWGNANPDPQIITGGLLPHYNTYGVLEDKAKIFKKIIYKELYPGIDIEYSFTETNRAGYEYRLVVRPGADISLIKMKWGSNATKLKLNNTGDLIINSDIDAIIQSAPVCYYADDSSKKIKVSFNISNKETGFIFPANYDTNKTIIIDPFVSNTSSLTTMTGAPNGKAKDIDFDYEGNIYVSGNSDGSAQKMAKFNAAGILQWTFNGSLSSPTWAFGGSQGGGVIEKTTGNAYLGQGLSGGGFRVVRLNTNGVYDNYISTANSNFGENWKMLWNCNAGVPAILIAGGGGSANNELAILSPPVLVPATSNISGLTGGHNDISDIVIDPVTNDMYTIFSISVNAPQLDSKIYKHTPPYSASTMAWSAFTGYFSLHEPGNRPYINGLDNSSNTICINNKYLFFWDGRNLKAFQKATGLPAGNPLTVSSATLLNQGGIFADECNNVFVGSDNGTIKVYQFDGTNFNDAAANDISITGYTTSVYDLEYDHSRNLLYASGNGFVASFDISQYCAVPVYTVTVVSDIPNLTATVTLTPAPSAGSVVTYSLYNGATFLTSNTTGIFTGLSTAVTYTVKVIINESCSGTQLVKNFILAGPPPPTEKPAIYVPGAFTPDGNGVNDVLKVLVFGIKEVHYFSVYNRYGELVFTTKDPAMGWDGTFKGSRQNTGGFTWMVEAVDFSGNILRQKGTTTLIR
jgi:gliding motility-associated-like protein